MTAAEIAAQEAQNENAANVANETAQDGAEGNAPDSEATNEKGEDGEELTAEQKKAAQVLRARLPKLAAANLNFEKRTGNFFAGTLVKETEKDENGNDKTGKDGKPIYVIDPATNKPVEKLRRLVVELNDPQTGEIKPQYADCLDEINAKRAAAMVLNGEKGRAKLEAERAAAEKALAESTAALATFDSDMTAALEIVATVELPERAERVAVTAKLNAAQDENAKLRAILIAAGLDPETGLPIAQ